MNTEKYQFDYDQYLQQQHLSQAQPAIPSPPDEEVHRYIRKVARDFRFLDPDSIAAEFFRFAVWDAAGRALRVEGRVLQSYLRDLAKERPELIKPWRAGVN